MAELMGKTWVDPDDLAEARAAKEAGMPELKV